MMESIFGSGSPVWTGIPPTGVGWVPGVAPIGVRPMSPAPGVGSTVQDATFGGVSRVVAPLIGAELSVVPAPALLTAIAVRRGQQGPTTDGHRGLPVRRPRSAGRGERVEVHSEGGRTTLTGSVTQKRLKRDIGEIAWAIPRVNDVQNNLTITARRRSRTSTREIESPSHASGRKPA